MLTRCGETKAVIKVVIENRAVIKVVSGMGMGLPGP
jgi:hypothetical protein